MLGIFVDIENELSDVAREVEMLSRSLELYGNPPKDGPDAWHWITVSALARCAPVGRGPLIQLRLSSLALAKASHPSPARGEGG